MVIEWIEDSPRMLRAERTVNGRIVRALIERGLGSQILLIGHAAEYGPGLSNEGNSVAREMKCSLVETKKWGEKALMGDPKFWDHFVEQAMESVTEARNRLRGCENRYERVCDLMSDLASRTEEERIRRQDLEFVPGGGVSE